MEKIKVEREAIVLDKEEIKNLKACLDYCYHRLSCHISGLRTQVDIKFVDYIRKNL